MSRSLWFTLLQQPPPDSPRYCLLVIWSKQCRIFCRIDAPAAILAGALAVRTLGMEHSIASVLLGIFSCCSYEYCCFSGGDGFLCTNDYDWLDLSWRQREYVRGTNRTVGNDAVGINDITLLYL